MGRMIYTIVNNYYAHLNRTRAEENGELMGTRSPVNRDLILPVTEIPLLKYWCITGYENSLLEEGKPPVSPPCSPRSDGAEDGDDGDDIAFVPYIIIHGLWFDLQKRGKPPFPKKRYPKIIKRKNTVRDMRRRGMLKQPGGSSCNQRR